MTLDDLQAEVNTWVKTYGVRYFDEKTNMLLLTEEVGELARLIARKYGEQSFKKPKKEEEVNADIEDELADICFVLVCLANQMGINLKEAVLRNLNKKTARDNRRHLDNKKLL